MRPIIGRDYHPAPTLRRMPRHWVLETERRPLIEWRASLTDPDLPAAVVCAVIAVLAAMQLL